MNTFMIDQKNRTAPHSKMITAIGAIAITAALAMFYAVAGYDSSANTELTTIDWLVSDDMDEYMAIDNNCNDYDEGDMQ